MEKQKKYPQPFGSFVVIKPRAIEKMSKGGIWIARSDEDRDQGSVTDGEVVAIGPLAFNDEMNPSGEPWYKVGDKVVFVKYGGKAINYDGQLLLLFRYEDIICKIEDSVSFKEGEE